jgi:hypothetical protein
MDALVQSLDRLRTSIREVEEKQMGELLEIINPVFSRYGYDLVLKEEETPRFQVGYEGQYEASLKYKNRKDGTLIEFLYQEGRTTPISLAIKAKGTMSKKYEKPKTLQELSLAVKDALLR